MTKPWRIAAVDLTFNWPPVGGSWVDVKEILSRLAGMGHQVTLFCPHWERYYPRGRIDESRLPFRVVKIPFNRFTFNAPMAGRRFRRAIEAFHPDVVFLGDGYFMKGALLPYLSRWPLIVRFYAYELICINLHYYLYHEERICDGGFLEDPDRCHHCWYVHRTSPLRHLAGIILGVPDKHPKLHFSQEYIGSGAFTKRYRQMLREWLGIPAAIVTYNAFTRDFLKPYNDNVLVYPSGVDTNVFTPAQGEREAGPPRILMTGRVNDPLKGFPVVLEACNALQKEGREFEVLITAAMDMGEIPAPYVRNLGWLPPEQLNSLYHRGDISLVPSTWVEPFGITAVESMASGLPVIASRIGGLQESVVDGETGLLVPPEDPKALAAALRKLLDDPELRQRMGKAGRKRAEEVFDWDVLVRSRYLPLLEEIIP